MTRKPSPTTARRPPTDSSVGQKSIDEKSADEKSADQKSADQKKDADWGFNSKKQEKVLEPRLGIILAVSLLLMFGFVLYQKYQSIQKLGAEAMAEESASEEGPDSDPQPVDPQLGETRPESKPAHPHFEPTPTLAENTLASATSSTSPGGHADSHPFEAEHAAGEFSGTGIAGPPAQSEPPPFGEPAHPHVADVSPDVSPDVSSEHAANSDPFFHEGPSSHQHEPAGTFGLDAAQAAVPTPAPDSSPRPVAWDFEGGTESAHDAHAESALVDPFAASGESHTEASPAAQGDAQQHLADQHEPHPLESVDLAMPLSQAPPSQTEPDPFAQGDPFGHDAPSPLVETPPAEPSPAEDANPFGNLAGAEPPPDGQTTPHGNWPVEDGSHHQLAEAPHPLPAPALPGDHDDANRSFSTTDSDWDLESVPHDPVPRHDPVASHSDDHGDGQEHEFGFPPSPDEHHAGGGLSAQATPLAVVGEREITVTQNDSLWSISQDAYGTARYVPALARYNRDRVPHPNKLRRGVPLRIPPPEVLEAHFPDLFHRQGHRDAMVSPAGGTSARASGAAPSGLFSDAAGHPYYRVGKHDTLSRIAQRYLTRASRWTDIFAMNRDRLKRPETLKPGMILRMPADACPVAVFSGSPASR